MGGRTKATPNKSFQTKSTRTKHPGHEPPRTKTNLPVKTYVCMHVLLNIRGWFPRCVTYFRGVPRCVTMCDRGKGESKLVRNSVTYFMDGPSARQIKKSLKQLA